MRTSTNYHRDPRSGGSNKCMTATADSALTERPRSGKLMTATADSARTERPRSGRPLSVMNTATPRTVGGGPLLGRYGTSRPSSAKHQFSNYQDNRYITKMTPRETMPRPEAKIIRVEPKVPDIGYETENDPEQFDRKSTTSSSGFRVSALTPHMTVSRPSSAAAPASHNQSMQSTRKHFNRMNLSEVLADQAYDYYNHKKAMMNVRGAEACSPKRSSVFVQGQQIGHGLTIRPEPAGMSELTINPYENVTKDELPIHPRPEIQYLKGHYLKSCLKMHLMENLKIINISRAPITTLHPIGLLCFLEKLDCSLTRITSLAPLASLDQYSTLSLGHPTLVEVNAAFCLSLNSGLDSVKRLKKIILFGCVNVKDEDVLELLEISDAEIVTPTYIPAYEKYKERILPLAENIISLIMIRDLAKPRMKLEFCGLEYHEKAMIENGLTDLSKFLRKMAFHAEGSDSARMEHVCSLNFIWDFFTGIIQVLEEKQNPDAEDSSLEDLEELKHIVEDLTALIKNVGHNTKLRSAHLSQDQFIKRCSVIGVSREDAADFLKWLTPRSMEESGTSPPQSARPKKSVQVAEPSIPETPENEESELSKKDIPVDENFVSEHQIQEALSRNQICKWEDFVALYDATLDRFGSPEAVCTQPMPYENFKEICIGLNVENHDGLFRTLQKDGMIPTVTWASLRFALCVKRLYIMAAFAEILTSHGSTITESLKNMDDNKSGAISFSEFEAGIRKLDKERLKEAQENGNELPEPQLPHAKDLWCLLDLDRSNILNFNEIKVWEKFDPEDQMDLVEEFQHIVLEKFTTMEAAFERICGKNKKMTKKLFDHFVKNDLPEYKEHYSFLFSFIDRDASNSIDMKEWAALAIFPFTLRRAQRTFTMLKNDPECNIFNPDLTIDETLDVEDRVTKELPCEKKISDENLESSGSRKSDLAQARKSRKSVLPIREEKISPPGEFCNLFDF